MRKSSEIAFMEQRNSRNNNAELLIKNKPEEKGRKTAKSSVHDIPILEYNNATKTTNIVEVKKALDTYCKINFHFINDCIDANRIRRRPRPDLPTILGGNQTGQDEPIRVTRSTSLLSSTSSSSSASSTSASAPPQTSSSTSSLHDMSAMLTGLPSSLAQEVIKNI